VKILIISSPRCGSSRLTESLAKALGLKQYHEPYNKFWGSKYFKKDWDFFEDNCIVKLMSYEKGPTFEGTTLEFLLQLSNQFDKVIFLDRKDFQAQLESYSFMRQHRYSGDWQAPYIYNKNTDLNVDNYYLSVLKDNVKYLANQMGKNITYYEDIYSDDAELVESILRESDINVKYEDLLPHIHTKNKLRISEKNISLI